MSGEALLLGGCSELLAGSPHLFAARPGAGRGTSGFSQYCCGSKDVAVGGRLQGRHSGGKDGREMAAL